MIRPTCSSGANTAERAPSTTRAWPLSTRCHWSSRSPSPRPLCNTARRSPKRLWKWASSWAATTGTRPVGWLSRGPCSPATRRLIVEEGFGYHMGDRSRDEPSIDRTLAGPIVVLPFAPDSDDLGMCQAPWLTSRDWLAYACDSFDRLLDESHSRPRMMSLGVHLRIIGRPGRIGALEKFLQHARAARGVWWARSRDIAAHWARVAAAD